MSDNQGMSCLPARQMSRWFYVGPLALFVAASAYGVLEVHGDADTWIGLAAGRQILASPQVPTVDSFSFTCDGQPWYNQNWLTHACQYWLYFNISPDAVVYATWTLAASVFLFTLLAADWRSNTWFGAILAGAVVGLGCRDYLSARPATSGFFCLAALWALICAIEGRRDKRRWWPIVLLAPLLLIWGAAHGSFVFGYGLLGLYVAYSFVTRVIGARRAPASSPPASGRQMIGVISAMLVALVITVLFGPFGIENFTHGGKVAGSSIWRSVSEWLPPTVTGVHFPFVWRFWTILGAALGLLAVGGAYRLLARKKLVAGSSDVCPQISLFDLAGIAIGLGMTLWARRFVPIFLVLSAPPVLVLIVRLLGPMGAVWRGRLLRTTAVLAGVCAIGIGYQTASRAHADLGAGFVDRPQYNLLERVTRRDLTPLEAIEFLKSNQLELNLLIEWPLAGDVMLDAPSAKVFIDGRAQQLYDEQLYQEYRALLTFSDAPQPKLLQILDRRGVDAVLLRRWAPTAHLELALRSSPTWIPALLGRDYELFLRRESRGLKRLGQLLRRGEEWRPENLFAEASRGFVWRFTEPPDLQKALDCWIAGVRENIELGTVCFPQIVAAYVELGRYAEARSFVEMYERTISLPFSGMPEDLRQQLLESLAACRRYVDSAEKSP